MANLGQNGALIYDLTSILTTLQSGAGNTRGIINQLENLKKLNYVEVKGLIEAISLGLNTYSVGSTVINLNN